MRFNSAFKGLMCCSNILVFNDNDNMMIIIVIIICLLKDVAISSDRNIIQKDAEKEVKCKTEYRNSNNVVQEIVNRVTGIVTNELKIYMEMIPDKHSLGCLLATDMLRTLHIIRQVVAVQYLKPDWWNEPLVQDDNYQGKETD